MFLLSCRRTSESNSNHQTLRIIEEDMRHLSGKVVLVVTAITVAVMPLASQAPVQKPSFEVASVKPSVPGSRIVRFSSSGGRFSTTMTTLRILLQLAYQPQDGSAFIDSRIIGAPGWVDTDLFDVEAKTEEASSGPIPKDKLQPMLQSLLEDRFQLKAHWEMREMPVYLLTVGKGGSKLKLSEDQSPYGPEPPNTPIEQRRGMMRRAGDAWIGNAVRVSAMASFLSGETGRPVLGKTGLEGMFDFKMNWVPPSRPAPGVSAGPEALPQASDPGASIFTAIQELGLKLESAKAPLEVLMIDSVQKPSEN
jgi:uncharacterized protein (TIGR03435 family)